MNLLFALCHPMLGGAISGLPPFAASLLVNAALFILPAVGWNMLLPGIVKARGMRLFCSVAISTCTLLVGLAAIRLLGWTLTTAMGWSVTWILSNCGFLCAWRFRRGKRTSRVVLTGPVVLSSLVFFLCYGFYFWGALRVVPPENDHDLEVHATGYSLLTRLEPFLLTDRGTLHYFAHPPLLHFYVGASFLYFGDLMDLKFYDDVSQRARDQQQGREVPFVAGKTYIFGQGEGIYDVVAKEGALYRLVPEGGGAAILVSSDITESGRIYQRYAEVPLKLQTRTPNLFFASATVAMLAFCIMYLSRRWWFALLAAFAYASSPEIFVRSSYGGYFAVGGFAVICILMAAYRWRRAAGPLAAGAFGALVDHKLVLLPAAMGLQLAGQFIRKRQVKDFWRCFHPVILGFGLGTALFWTYGLSLSAPDFIGDHLRHHLLDRITHTNALGYEGYASDLGLWKEFLVHTSYVVLPMGVFLLAYDMVVLKNTQSRDLVSMREVCALFILLTAIVFTAIDWRMTKHLILILIPLHLAMSPRPESSRWRVVLPTITLLLAVMISLWVDRQIAYDFFSFKVTPAW